MTDFCKRNDISSSAFYSALKRSHKGVKSEVTKKFIKEVPDKKSVHSYLVTLPNSVKIEMACIDGEVLKTLMMIEPS